MPKILFTDLAIQRLSTEGVYFDTKTPAFGLRVGKNRKTWMVMRGRNRTRIRLGHYPALNLTEAKRKAYIALGQEPEAETAARLKFETIIQAFLNDHYKDKRPRTAHEARRLLTNHFVGINKMVLSNITDREINTELGKLAKTPSEQLHAFRVLRVFFKWCLRPPRRYIKHSPLEGYPAPSKDKKGTRILTDAELNKVWHACEGYFGDMIRLLILWGCRNGEIGRLQPGWYADKVMTIPGTHTKNSRPHAIPVLPMARAILERRKTNGVYYFTGRTHDSHFNDGSWGKLKKDLDRRSGVTGWQLRDLRRTFRSTLARLGIPREIAEILLNHVTGAGKNDLDEIYNRYEFLAEKRAALQKYEAHLRKIVA